MNVFGTEYAQQKFEYAQLQCLVATSRLLLTLSAFLPVYPTEKVPRLEYKHKEKYIWYQYENSISQCDIYARFLGMLAVTFQLGYKHSGFH